MPRARNQTARTDQPRLPGLNGNGAGPGDSAFTLNRAEPVHRWVPWIAGFSAGFVDDILDRVPVTGNRAPTVLDPFAGVGTTLVQAMRRGWNAVGFEINPYAALACRAKLRIASYRLAALREATDALAYCVAERSKDESATPTSAPPHGFRSRAPFFSPSIERQVLFAMDFIADVPDKPTADFLRVALGATMVGYSNYSYEPSLGRRVCAGKEPILEADVAAVLRAKLEAMCDDVEHWQASAVVAPEAQVHAQSYLADACPVPPNSIDALITSPPYLNNYHYPRNTRPHLYWLGLVAASQDMKHLEHESFGKFWQTVRAGPEVELEVDDADLREQIVALRGRNRDRGVYGGAGWANYAATYFNDCGRFCARTAALMRPGGLVVVVIGNNIVQGIEFRTDEILARLAARHGLECTDIHQVRRKRTGSSIINSSVRVGKAGGRVELYESAVDLKRT
ncbi:MAG: site-specific DNA-methyltransferase [Gemmatimonadetes bacterium]|nr:site-specific DNA-methyltransferase [Gemmatimonadota bacterium]